MYKDSEFDSAFLMNVKSIKLTFFRVFFTLKTKKEV